MFHQKPRILIHSLQDTVKKLLLDVCRVFFRISLLLDISHSRLMLPDDEPRQSKTFVEYPEDSLTMLERYVIFIHNGRVPLDINNSSTHHAGTHPTGNTIVPSYQHLVV